MRYNRLMDIGMAEEDIRKMLPEGSKLGSTMKAMMDAESAKAAFSVAPPDLSVIARSATDGCTVPAQLLRGQQPSERGEQLAVPGGHVNVMVGFQRASLAG
jgi:hypothetical protein